jgi:hypothetical protein
MNSSDSPYRFHLDDGWNLEQALQLWDWEGGLVPDVDPADFSLDAVLAQVPTTSNPPTS